MSKRCQVSKKRFNKANSVSFSNKHTRRRQEINLQTKRLWDAEGNCWVRIRASARVIKTITTYGLRSALKRYGALDLVQSV
ncbi:MAG: 50S ribosomal protein L28 [Vampirovibrionales bacterium]|jgi:large subunit ribosomal protein L28|nr:50S ribosomal protein L28 [Vampirovibrionales bacterium]